MKMQMRQIMHQRKPDKRRYNGQPGVPKVNADTARRGLGELYTRRLKMSLTRKSLAELTGIPMSRICRAEAKGSRNEAAGRRFDYRFTAADHSVVEAIKEAEAAGFSGPAMPDLPANREAPTPEPDEASDLRATLAVSSVDAGIQHLKRMLPEGSKITITLPSGLELKVV